MESLASHREIKRNQWTLMYNPEFEVYREKYENIISSVKKVIDGETVEGIKVNEIGEKDGRKYFTLMLGDKSFLSKKH